MLLVIAGFVSLLPSPWNDTIVKYLPASAGASMAATVQEPTLLTPGAGLAVLALYVIATLSLAGVVFDHRDA